MGSFRKLLAVDVFKLQCRRPLTFLIKIKLLKIGATINWGRFSLGPGPDLGTPSPDPL
jgi:hypothetical protein